jgi:hypothetical protein
MVFEIGMYGKIRYEYAFESEQGENKKKTNFPSSKPI